MQQDPLYHDFFAVVGAVSHNIIQMIYSCFEHIMLELKMKFRFE